MDHQFNRLEKLSENKDWTVLEIKSHFGLSSLRPSSDFVLWLATRPCIRSLEILIELFKFWLYAYFKFFSNSKNFKDSLRILDHLFGHSLKDRVREEKLMAHYYDRPWNLHYLQFYLISASNSLTIYESNLKVYVFCSNCVILQLQCVNAKRMKARCMEFS